MNKLLTLETKITAIILISVFTLPHQVIWKECGHDRYIDFYTCIEKVARNFQPSCKVVHTGERFVASNRICISGYDGSNEQECFMFLP